MSSPNSQPVEKGQDGSKKIPLGVALDALYHLRDLASAGATWLNKVVLSGKSEGGPSVGPLVLALAQVVGATAIFKRMFTSDATNVDAEQLHAVYAAYDQRKYSLVQRITALLAEWSDRPSQTFEVEGKWPIMPTEWDQLPQRLAAIGFKPGRELSQIDTFLPVNKPGDIRRIRCEQVLSQSTAATIVLTEKSKVEVAGVKTRRETETSLTAEQQEELLAAARAQTNLEPPVLTKMRYEYLGKWAGKPVTVCLDRVHIGGQTRCFLEVELLVQWQDEVWGADACVNWLACQILGEPRPREPRSLKEILFDSLGRQ